MTQQEAEPRPTPAHTIRHAAVVGAGTIGLSWAALFAAHGVRVRLTDPRSDLVASLDGALPMLAASLDSTADELRPLIEVTGELADAVAGADLVQENGPERLEFKQELFAEIAEHAPAGALLASSSSGIVPSAIAEPLPAAVAGRLLVAHPFNPPHVVPLVELVPGERTDEQAVQRAERFYRALDRTPVRLHREVEGFAANRLQSAVLQEAFHLVLQGVVDVSELDTLVRASLGQRWATVGPFESYHLGGGPGGIRHMFAHLGRSMAASWQRLGHPEMTETDVAQLTEQTEAAYGTGPDAYRERAQRRDRVERAVDRAAAG